MSTSAPLRSHGELADQPLAAPAVAPALSDFPPDFVWGAATAAYQVEGGIDEDGRTPSIWDTFCTEPGRVRGGHSGAVACDHRHRWRDDVALMADLGLRAYRFSLSWPRVLPGAAVPSPLGIGFYDRLVDELLAAGIDPWVTLYHWDLPQELEDAGGWPTRETAHRLADLAEVAGAALGDRVKNWITLNEPWCSAFLGYGSGLHAPGRADPAAAVSASHHLLLAHGESVHALRATVPDARVGVTLNLYPVAGIGDDAATADLVRRIDGLHNRWFLDPVLLGRYPEDVVRDLGDLVAPDLVQPDDLQTIAQPLDFLGINYYTRHNVRPSVYPGTNAADFGGRWLHRSVNGWEVDPDGLHETLVRVARDYPALPLVVTENGSAWPDRVEADGTVQDQDRLDFLGAHLEACARARRDGADVAGYFAWSLLDNFEWAEGYAVRFGIVHVDYSTQRRTVKASGRWYADFLRSPDGILSP